MENQFKHASDVIKKSKILIITAGAGIGVDSGLPDYRGKKGFWKEYPLYEKLNLDFFAMANPTSFEKDPAIGWGFYGHRRELYNKTIPHDGFKILLKWIEQFNLKYFVVTSNVDGQFQKAGFSEDKIYEIHGSIHHNQCLLLCKKEIWINEEEIKINFNSMKALNIPKCKFCGFIARPNVLMFGDWGFCEIRNRKQNLNYLTFIAKNRHKKIVIIEIGAGTEIPSIRTKGQLIAKQLNGRLIRINPREHKVPSPGISLKCNGLEALVKLDLLLNNKNI